MNDPSYIAEGDPLGLKRILAEGLERIDALTDDEINAAANEIADEFLAEVRTENLACQRTPVGYDRQYYIHNASGVNVHTPFTDQACELFNRYGRTQILSPELLLRSGIGDTWESNGTKLEVRA